MEVSGTPYLLGVDDAGAVVYYDYLPNKVRTVTRPSRGATPQTSPAAVFSYDPVHRLLLGGTAPRASATAGIGELAAASSPSDSTAPPCGRARRPDTVDDVSPDGSRLLGAVSTTSGELGVPVLDTVTGDLLATLDVEIDGKLAFVDGWYDDDRVLVQIGGDRNARYVLLDLDGQVEQLTDLNGPDVLWEDR